MKRCLSVLFLFLLGAGRAHADSTTARVGMTKPTVGTTGWGTKLNTNFDLIDSTMAALWQTNTFNAANTFNGKVTFQGPEPFTDVKAYSATGNGLTDDRSSIQTAINSAGNIYFSSGTYLISASLSIPSNRHLILSPYAVLKASNTAWVDTAMFDINGSSNVMIEGPGTLDGDKANNATGRIFGVAVRGNAARVTLMGFTAKNMPGQDATGINGGDGVYIGVTGSTPTDITVTNCILDSNVRQGITVTEGQRIRLIGNSLLNTSGSAPGCGIDLEPNDGTQPIYDIIVDHNNFYNNHCGLSYSGSSRVQGLQLIGNTGLTQNLVNNTLVVTSTDSQTNVFKVDVPNNRVSVGPSASLGGLPFFVLGRGGFSTYSNSANDQLTLDVTGGSYPVGRIGLPDAGTPGGTGGVNPVLHIVSDSTTTSTGTDYSLSNIGTGAQVHVWNANMSRRLVVGPQGIQASSGTTTTTDLYLQPNGGNVGVGLTNPTHKLEVSGGDFFLANGNNLNTNSVYNGVGSADLVIQEPNTGRDLHLRGKSNVKIETNGSTVAVYVSTMQYVGIGTTSPAATLDVVGTSRFQAGTGTGRYAACGVIYYSTISVTTTGTSLQTISTVTIAANTLDVLGRTILVRAWGKHAANTNAATLQIFWGGNSIGWNTTQSSNGASWFGEATIMRTASSGQRYESHGVTNQSNFFPSAGTASLDLTTDENITFQATTGTQAGDVTLDGILVIVFP